MLTIAKLSRWSINYYNDTARAAEQAAKDVQRLELRELPSGDLGGAWMARRLEGL
jgi:hypothetical protein